MSLNVWANYTKVTVLEKYNGSIAYNQKYPLKIRFDSDMTEGTVYLFRYRLDRYPFNGRIWAVLVENSDGGKVHHFIPCFNPDGEYGMYDIVTDVFHGNLGTGAFTGGPVVHAPVVSGTIDITTNGEHDVAAFEKANVQVPIPEGYIQPSGTKEITENGTHNVREYESVEVSVESGGGDGQDYPVYDGEPIDITETELTDRHAVFKAETEPMIVDGQVAVKMNKNDLGAVMAEQVPEGYTFTSKYGINQVGKMPVYDYTPIEGHYYRDDGDNFVFDAPVESFVVLEDEVSVKVPKKDFGNTYPHMVVDGWEFTSAGGVKQKGTMPVYDYTPIEGSFAGDDDDNLLFMAASPQQQVVEDDLWVSVPREDFGNAKPEDVAEGAIFTSAEGYRQVGTHKCSGGGNDDTLKQLIEGTLTSFYDDQITHIRIRMFGYNNALKEVELPNAKTMGMAAFASATALETVKLDSIETLVVGAQDQQFYSCTSLKNVSMNSLKVVGAMSFDGCTALKQVYLPSLTRVGGNGFIRSGLETAHFPVLSSIGTSAFASTKLKTLVLGGDAVVTLDNVSAFTGTPFASGGTGGTVYVKQALIPNYQTATNWSALYAAGTCAFVAIEGSEYE